jgi:hypothetical protein
VLRSSGAPINDGDAVAPTAALSMQILSPRPLASPQTEITLLVNGHAQAFTATPAPGDASNREWILSWTHADYPIDDYTVLATVQNGGSVTHRFKVTASSGQLAVRDLIPFPNPFDNSGTRFSFLLVGGENADVKVHVFSQSGRSIYTNVFHGLTPGYHQLAWDGHDAEGDELANTYFFRLSVTTTSGATTQQLGRLVLAGRTTPRSRSSPTYARVARAAAGGRMLHPASSSASSLRKRPVTLLDALAWPASPANAAASSRRRRTRAAGRHATQKTAATKPRRLRRRSSRTTGRAPARDPAIGDCKTRRACRRCPLLGDRVPAAAGAVFAPGQDRRTAGAPRRAGAWTADSFVRRTPSRPWQAR